MEENEIFLKYLIDEEIYIVDDDPSFTMEAAQPKDDDRSRDRKEDTTESSSVAVEVTEEAISSGDDKPVKSYQDITVLLLDYADQSSMPAGHIDLLVKILQSVNLDPDSVEMVFRDKFTNLEVKDFTDCRVIAFLNLVPEQLNALFAVEKYMINMINGNQFIISDTLSDLIKERSLKRKLWEQIKLIYGL